MKTILKVLVYGLAGFGLYILVTLIQIAWALMTSQEYGK